MRNIPFMSVWKLKPTRTEALEYLPKDFFPLWPKCKPHEGVETFQKSRRSFSKSKPTKSVPNQKNRYWPRDSMHLPNLMNVPGDRRLGESHAFIIGTLAIYRAKKYWVVGEKRIQLWNAALWVLGAKELEVAWSCWEGGDLGVFLEKFLGNFFPKKKKKNFYSLVNIGCVWYHEPDQGRFDTAYPKFESWRNRQQEVIISTPEGEVTIEMILYWQWTGYKPNFGFYLGTNRCWRWVKMKSVKPC